MLHHHHWFVSCTIIVIVIVIFMGALLCHLCDLKQRSISVAKMIGGGRDETNYSEMFGWKLKSKASERGTPAKYTSLAEMLENCV